MSLRSIGGFLQWVLLAAFVAASATAHADEAPTRLSIQVESKIAAASLRLDASLWRPSGVSRPPLVVWNHGDLAAEPRGDKSRAAVRGGPYVKPFLDAGYAVLVFSRRGVGRSEGQYAPKAHQGCLGLWDGSEIEDLSAVVDYAKRQLKGVDAEALVLAGQSAGGLLALAYASHHSNDVRAVLNFAGGWSVSGCSNKALYASLGRGFKKPSLWLYASNDRRHRLESVRERLATYNAAGGRARLVELEKVQSGDGHAAYQFPELWRTGVLRFMKSI